MKSKRLHKSVLFIFLGALMLFAALFGGRNFLPAFADERATNALEDLQKDETFNESDYPADVKDNSIQVIQIAESVDGKLVVYTYQPAQALHYLVATDINMSLSDSVNGTSLYSLTLINVSGVFGKYVVNDFTVKGDEAKRYYNVTSIYRDFDRYLDEPSSLDDTITKIASPVGKLFLAETVGDDIVYSEQIKEVVTVTDKYVGNIMYEGDTDIGWGIKKNATNAMYVAFNTDWDIARLYEADVQYSTKSLEYTVYLSPGKHWAWELGEVHDVKKGDPVRQSPVTLKYDRKDSAGNYSWYQIQSVNEFKSNVSKNGMELTTDAQEGLKGKKWVLCFANVDVEAEIDNVWISFLIPAAMGDAHIRTTLVGDVSVLRLKFEYQEEMYDLGAVDGASTPSGKPSNKLDGYDENNENFSAWQWLKDKLGIGSFKMPWWGWVIIAVVVLAILLPILGYFIPAVRNFLLVILKGIWWLISAPFRGIAVLVRKIWGE